MAAHKRAALIHLLEQEQEPFHLQTYIANRRSQFNKSPPTTTTALHLGKRKPLAQETTPKSGAFCFYSLRRSPEVSNSPITPFQSPAMTTSPCNMSPVSPVFLRVPPSTAALLVEAAMRIQKRRQSQVRILGFGLFGAFLKRLKDRNNKHKKRAIADNEIKILRKFENTELEDQITFNSHHLRNCRSEQSKEINDQCSLREALLCSSPVSPFRFSLHRSPSSSGCRTPEFRSPANSPMRHSQKGQGNSQATNPDNAEGEEDDEGQKEQCSPVSVLDSFFEDDEHGSIEPEGDDSDHESSYANVQRVKQQLLYRLRRFEKLAELDPIEFEKRLLESNSDDECHLDSLESSAKGEPSSPCRYQDIELAVLKLSSLLQHNSSDTKTLFSGNIDVWGRICKKLESWKQVEFIDTLVELDFKNEFEGWRKFSEEVEGQVEEVEVAIFGLLVDELLL